MTADIDATRFAPIAAFRADEVDDRELVSEAWKQLHPSHREVLRRAYHLGWTTGQIAADLNISEPLVKSRLHDALHTLRLIVNDPTLPSRIVFARGSESAWNAFTQPGPPPR